VLLIAFCSCDNHEAEKKLNEIEPEYQDKKLSEPSKTILPAFQIDIKCGGELIPLRSIALSEKELKDSQLGNEYAKKLNDETVLGLLKNGERIRLIKDTSFYHYVEVLDSELKGSKKRGYIVNKFCGESVLRKIEEKLLPQIEFSSQSVSTYNWIDEHYRTKSEFRQYTYAFVSQEADFIQTLSFDDRPNNQWGDLFFEVWVVELQKTGFLYSDWATKTGSYIDADGQNISVYNCDTRFWEGMSIHISDDGRFAFIETKNDSHSTCAVELIGLATEGIIMQRIGKGN
ncbi:hypothetical protein N8Z47_06100, partial [Salibacteraceae bacterium]|nr:hypothetical protein [Salibacteraceae bacterium]